MLSERSKQVRRDTLNLSKANGGYHYGGCFSVTEILITLFDKILEPNDELILSKGHACWPYYVLLQEQGFNPRLSGHPSRDAVNGIPCTTGSLGHGLPSGIGIAKARQILGKPGNVFVVMGDGECQEGTTWESLLIASRLKLGNLIVVVDWNGIQGSGRLKDILPIPHFDKVVELLGWYVLTVDGHHLEKLEFSLKLLTKRCPTPERPKLLIASTIKGKGVSYMEDNPKWHANWPDDEHFKVALKELE